MADKTRIGVVGISTELVSIAQRREDIVAGIDEAAANGCTLVCFPEYAAVQRTTEAVEKVDAGCGDDIYAQTAEAVPGGSTCVVVAEACRRNKVWATIGLCERRDDGRVTNSMLFFDEAGEIQARHMKTHLAPGEEVADGGGVDDGDKLEPLETPFGRVGVLTCYEAYFPEIARVYQAKGADWLFYPHADNSEHCLRVGQARAFDSYMPLVMCGYVTPGTSAGEGPSGVAVVDARGRVIGHRMDAPGVLVVDVDLQERVRAARRWDRPDEIVDERDYRWNRRRPELFGPLAT